MVYTKPCSRGGCTGLVKAPTRVVLAPRRYCCRPCRHLALGASLSDHAWQRRPLRIVELPSYDGFTEADLVRALDRLRRGLPLGEDTAARFLPSPSNNVTHRRIRDDQLRMWREYLDAERATAPARKRA